MPAISFFFGNWRWLVPAALAAILGVLLLVRTAQRDAARESYARESAAHGQTIASYRNAQAAAQALADAERARVEGQYRQAAERADHAESQLAEAHDAAARFADARRLRAVCPSAGSAPGRTDTPAKTGAAEDRDGPGADAVVLDRGEYDQLVANTLRLERVRRWGDDLLNRGLAVRAVD